MILKNRSEKNEDKRAILATKMAHIFACFAAPYIVIFWHLNLVSQSIIAILIVLTLLGSTFTNRFSLPSLTKFSIILAVDFGLLFYASCFGPMAGIQLLFFSLISIPLVLFSPKNPIPVLLGISLPILSFFYLEITNYTLFKHVPIEPIFLKSLYYTTISVTFFIIILSIFFYYLANEKAEEALEISNNQLSTANKDLEKTNDELQEKNKSNQVLLHQIQQNIETGKLLITSLQKSEKEKETLISDLKNTIKRVEHEKQEKEAALHMINKKNKELDSNIKALQEKAKTDKDIEAAQIVQKAAIPEIFPQPKGMAITHWYQAAKIIGGDFMDGIVIDEDRTLIVFGDIVGKGIQASLKMAAFYPLFRMLSETFTTLQNLVERCSREVEKFYNLTQYIPCIVILIDTKTNTLSYCNAGHETGYIFRETETLPLSSGGPPFGADINPNYIVTTIPLQKNDRILLFTDGFTDIKNPLGHRLESDGLLPLIQAFHISHPNTFVETLTTKLMAFKHTADQTDDMSIISITVT